MRSPVTDADRSGGDSEGDRSLALAATLDAGFRTGAATGTPGDRRLDSPTAGTPCE
ncbi:hypothetical protein [Halorubrum sp. HHNYT27]|uniref:hypothetical protein n=1 Tax=Halorubrum sp. HHNYT27 TaxID=3402275 RepID=UPI003EBAAE3C